MSKTSRALRRALGGTALLGAAAVVPLVTTAGVDDLVAAPAAATVDADACGPVITKVNGTPWTCTFVDHFPGSALNTNKWIVQETRRTGFTMGKTCFTASPDNVRVRDGELYLVAQEGPLISCRNPLGYFSTRYTGGMIGTRGRFSQTFGRFEVRARFPSARTGGVHGGFWMFPRDLAYGPWPASGEIDVAEWWSNDPTLMLPSLHYNGRDGDADSGWACRVADPSSYHTYAVEWLHTVMRFFIDRQMCFARSWTPDLPQVAPQPFDHPFSMILNMGVGPATGNNRVTWQTPFPARYVVKYAKAWR